MPAKKAGRPGVVENMSISSAEPPSAEIGQPFPIALPSVVRSGVTPAIDWKPPRACRKPVITSSKMSTVPCLVASSRSRSRKPSSGSTAPMLCGMGSRMIAATSCSVSARSTSSASLKRHTIVASVTSGSTPFESGSRRPTFSGSEMTFIATASCQPW